MHRSGSQLHGSLKLGVVLVSVFASTALLNVAFGWFRLDEVESLLSRLERNPAATVFIVVALLCVDSVLSVPTAATVTLAGITLGPWLGGTASALGMLGCGSICYFAGRSGVARRWLAPSTLSDVEASAQTVGAFALLLSRALPLMPETMSALAGVGKMGVGRYYLWFGMGNAPYGFALAYAGSISSFDNPWPALGAAFVVPVLGAGVMAFRRRRGVRQELAASRVEA